jgi:nitroimidazol reductase NimA-like FMN-containing flavoprotein (pyridoxamine 5'-phosphate oxidase superfamily)
MLKVVQALPTKQNPVTEEEINRFLESKLNIQLATIDEKGYPTIHTLWFLYDKTSGKLYVATQKASKKFHNFQVNNNKIYFSIDDEAFPYKGVKGRAEAKISENSQKNLAVVEKINLKYLGTNEHPLAKMILENTKSGREVVIEITPKFFSAWDFSKV